MAKIEVDVTLPGLPNYVNVGEAPTDVADLTEAVLREIGKEWTEALVAHAVERKANRSKPGC